MTCLPSLLRWTDRRTGQEAFDNACSSSRGAHPQSRAMAAMAVPKKRARVAGVDRGARPERSNRNGPDCPRHRKFVAAHSAQIVSNSSRSQLLEVDSFHGEPRAETECPG